MYPKYTPVLFRTISSIAVFPTAFYFKQEQSKGHPTIYSYNSQRHLKTRLVSSRNKQTANMVVSRTHAILLFILSSLPHFLICNPASFRPVFIVPNIRFFFGPPQPSTSKFPPVIELIVQRIQAQFSNYVYEDFSRPQTWDKPVYTLSPEEQATETATVSQNAGPTPQAVVEESEKYVFGWWMTVVGGFCTGR